MSSAILTRAAVLALLLASARPLGAQEAGLVVRATPLAAEPFADAKPLAQLAEQSPVTVLERRGGWMRVRAGGQEGWVRLLVVRTAAAPATGTAPAGTQPSGTAQLFNLARTGATGAQVTTGVRGLDQEDIRRAQPNPQELERMRGFAADRAAAERFAADAGLRAQAVEELAP